MRLAVELDDEPSPDDEPRHHHQGRPVAGVRRRDRGGDIGDSIAALPPDLQAAFAELRAALEVSPWTVGTPLVPSNPTGLRVATIGESSMGMVVCPSSNEPGGVALIQVSFIRAEAMNHGGSPRAEVRR